MRDHRKVSVKFDGYALTSAGQEYEQRDAEEPYHDYPVLASQLGLP